MSAKVKDLESMISRTLAANAETVAAFLNLMGNEKRLLIMNHIAGGELSVDLLSVKDLQPGAVLRPAAGIRGRNEGRLKAIDRSRS